MAQFNKFRGRKEAILQVKSFRLSIDEVPSVRNEFFIDHFLPEIRETMKLEEAHYNKIFDALQSIKWLKFRRNLDVNRINTVNGSWKTRFRHIQAREGQVRMNLVPAYWLRCSQPLDNRAEAHPVN